MGIISADFFNPQNGLIWDAIVSLVQLDITPDSITVASTLKDMGVLETVGGPATLISLQAGCPTPSNAGQYARLVLEAATRRRLIHTAAEIADEAYTSLDARTAIVGASHKLETWALASQHHIEPLVTDLIAMDGADPVIPNVATRDDGATALLYQPGVNWLSSEPGLGKSMLGLWWCLQEMRKQHHVIYLDWEGTAQGLKARLGEMGGTNDDMRFISYVRRSEPWNPGTLSHLRRLGADVKPTLVVFDAVAGAMEAEGLDPEQNTDVEQWTAGLPVWFSANIEAAVLALDHVAKNKESRGRWPIGAQRKLARADAAFMLDMPHPAGVGITSYGRLITAKDRYGALSPHQAGRTIAEVSIHSRRADYDSYSLHIFVTAPHGRGEDQRVTTPQADGTIAPPLNDWTPTWYMEQVSRLLEEHPDGLSESAIRQRLRKSSTYISRALDALSGTTPPYVMREGPRKPWRSIKPYRQPAPDRQPELDDEPPLDDDGLDEF